MTPALAAEWSTSPDSAGVIYVGSGTEVDVLANDSLPADAVLTYVDVPAEAGDLSAYVMNNRVHIFANSTAIPGSYTLTYGVWSAEEGFGADGITGSIEITVSKPLSVTGAAFGSPTLAAPNVSAMQPVTTQPAVANIEVASVEVLEQPAIGEVSVNADNSLTWDLSEDIRTDAALDAIRSSFISVPVRVTATDGQTAEINTALHIRNWTRVSVAVSAVDANGQPVPDVELALEGTQDVDDSVEQSLSLTSTTDEYGSAWLAYARSGSYRLSVVSTDDLEVRAITVDDETVSVSAEDGTAAVDLRAASSEFEYATYGVTVTLAEPAAVETPVVEEPTVTTPTPSNPAVQEPVDVPSPEVSAPELAAPVEPEASTPAAPTSPILRFETGEFSAPESSDRGVSTSMWVYLGAGIVSLMGLASVAIAAIRRERHENTSIASTPTNH